MQESVLTRVPLENVNRFGKLSRLGRPDISVLHAGRVKIEPNYGTARVYPSCSREPDGSGRVERCEYAMAQQKRMSDACRIDVFAYNVARGVVPPNKGKATARKINRDELLARQLVSLAHVETCSLRRSIVSTHDGTRRINGACQAPGCARWIEAGEDANYSRRGIGQQYHPAD
jgi:hypothetical protein